MADEQAAKSILKSESNLAKSVRKSRESILKALPAQKPNDWQKTTITRGALEALAAKAGVRMEWNNGEPVFHDDEVNEMERRYQDAERALSSDRVKQLERIVAQQRAGILSAQAAHSMAAAAGQQIDKMVSDVIKSKVNETLQSDIEANEKRIKADLKAGGASDEDIAAAEKLLGGMAPKFVESEPMTADSIKDALRKLQTLVPTTQQVIVHPNDVERLIQEKMAKALEADLRTSLPHLDPARYRRIENVTES